MSFYNRNMTSKREKKSRKSRKSRKPKRSKRDKALTRGPQCAPQLKNKSYTCYSDESLHKLKVYWNSRHPDVLIETNNSHEIWNKLKEYMSNTCEQESCWLRQKFIANNLDTNLLSYTFAPSAPQKWGKSPNEWLTSTDLEKVMKQYENSYPCFTFLGPSPIDFDQKKVYGSCVWDELCKFNLQDYIKKGKNKIGIIFNTDPHNKPGSHWIALFIDIKKKFIFFFDSNGDPTPNKIKKLVERIQSQGKSLNIDFIFHQNYPKEHQKSDTECGIYVLFFIIQLIKNTKRPSFFQKENIPDSEMESLRKIYFN